MTAPIQQDEYEQLFKAYLDICNRALAQHWGEFPYKQIWNAAKQAVGERSVQVAVYDDEPKTQFELRLEDDHLEASSEKEANDAPVWRMNLSYLRQVVEHPDDYIHNPARLDWDWLKSRPLHYAQGDRQSSDINA